MTGSLPDSERQIPLGMLVKHDISYLIKQKQIIQNGLYANLKDAVYEMRLGSYAFRWEGDKRNIIRLSDEEKQLRLPPNSLTFVTTLEKFNLPSNIIARFNLKVDWVHCGLLLGTGPIVNPGFKKYLLIPIHNFSSKEVQISYGQKLIAVEFTKIQNYEDESEVDLLFEQQDIKEDVEALVEPYSKEAQFVESSILKVLRDYEGKIERNTEEIKASKTEREKWSRLFTWGGVVSALVAVIALFSLLFTTWSVHIDTRQKILAAHEALLTTSDRLEKENVRMRNELATLAEQVRALPTSASGASSPQGNAQASQGQPNTNPPSAVPQGDQKAQPPLPSDEKTSTPPK